MMKVLYQKKPDSFLVNLLGVRTHILGKLLFDLFDRIRGLDKEGCGAVHFGASVPSDGEGHDAVVVKAGGGGEGKGTVG